MTDGVSLIRTSGPICVVGPTFGSTTVTTRPFSIICGSAMNSAGVRNGSEPTSSREWISSHSSEVFFSIAVWMRSMYLSISSLGRKTSGIVAKTGSS